MALSLKSNKGFIFIENILAMIILVFGITYIISGITGVMQAQSHLQKRFEAALYLESNYWQNEFFDSPDLAGNDYSFEVKELDSEDIYRYYRCEVTWAGQDRDINIWMKAIKK